MRHGLLDPVLEVARVLFPIPPADDLAVDKLLAAEPVLARLHLNG